MKFFMDGRLDTRPLDSQDKAHVPLPYDLATASKTNPAAFGDNSSYALNLTAADWGSGKDFYPVVIVLTITIAGAFMANAKEGFILDVQEVGGAYLLRKSYDNTKAFVVQGATNHYVAITETLQGNKISSSGTLSVILSNYTGATIPIGGEVIDISGIAV